jgi:hypothetical protein
MDEKAETPPLIVECPHCHIHVIPMANNVCPNCHEDVSDMTRVDPSQIPFTVFEAEEFPPHCYSCNQYTDRYIRVASDDETYLERLLFRNSLPEDTTKVIVYLPECELCSEKDVELIDVDYERQTMKIIVHRGFRDRVLQYRQNPPKRFDGDFDNGL